MYIFTFACVCVCMYFNTMKSFVTCHLSNVNNPFSTRGH